MKGMIKTKIAKTMFNIATHSVALIALVTYADNQDIASDESTYQVSEGCCYGQTFADVLGIKAGPDI